VSDTELLPKSKPDAVRRVEVFTGAGRRRAWTAEQKAQIIAESCEGGEPVSAVARRHGLTPQQLFGWRRQAQQRAGAEAGAIGFTPVIVEGSRPRSDAADAAIAPALPGSSGMIEIVLGTATVRLTSGIDGALLTMVLRAIRATM